MAESPEREQAVKDANALQRKITKQWNQFATITGREAYQDLMSYIDSQRDMYRQYGEELQMPSPDGKGKVPITPETAGILLQSSRGMNIVKTYIDSRVNTVDVAQSKKSNQ